MTYNESMRREFDPSTDAEQIAKKAAARQRANANRKARDEVMRDMGLVKVRGAVSGRTYWE